MKPKRIQEEKKLFLSKKHLTNIELCEHFGVSIETIRRDLNLLEEEGFIRKVYGGASIVENSQQPIPIDEWSVRMKKFPEAKRSMALEIVKLIPDGSTVFLDSGTTVYHVAEYLEGKKNITVLTNSIRIVEKLGMNKDIQVYVVGGIIKNEILASSGVFATEFLTNFFHIDYAVIACDGMIPDKGTTEHSFELAMLKKLVVKKTETTIVVADHSKMGLPGSCLCCAVEEINIVVVDCQTDKKHINTMSDHGIEVIVAPPFKS